VIKTDIKSETNMVLQNLPAGWIMTTIGEISEKPQYGWTTKANPEKGNVKLLRTTDITLGTIDWSSVPYCTIEPDDIEKYLVRTGDIVISRAGSVGASYLLTNVEKAVFASYLIRFRVRGDINKRYVYYFLKSSDYWKAIGASKSGIAVPNVNATKLAKVPIPLAPLLEQKRIVAEIEKQFSRLDEAVAALKRVKNSLKRYKASVLKAAVEGKLTEEWRKEHSDIEHGAILLNRIIKRRKEKSKGKNKKLTPLNKSELPRIPETWEWTRVGDIYDIVGGGTPATKVPEYWKGNIPWITSADIHGIKDVRPRKQISKKGVENSATNIVPKNSIIVVTRVGLGKVALTNSSICFSQDSQALIDSSSLLYADYSAYFLSKEVQIFKFKHRGTTIAGVTKRQLAELPFAVPPFLEQQKIVEEIERRLSLTEEIEADVERNLKRAERLRQSILKKAFSGRLVPHEPRDELKENRRSQHAY